MGKEALVVCSDRSIGIGITIWDIDTGDRLLHIPTCASPPSGLLCLRNHYLVASQIHKNGSVGGGAIFIWPLNKPQSPLRNYPIEAIGPICCTKDGVYLAGGAPSGSAYVWEVTSGKLLKSWRAHHKSLSSMMFSIDDSFLISGSNDGMIHVWSMISLLDVADYERLPPLYYSTSEHKSSITGLLSTSGCSSSVFISSSLDGTCKVWDLVTGRLLQSRAFPIAITSIALDPGEELLLSGSVDGRIFVNTIDIGLLDNPSLAAVDQPIVLNGHNGSITGLALCSSGLISISEDSTACLWDVMNGVIIRRFNHRKGAITNLLVIPQSSLLPVQNHHRSSNQSRVQLLEKYPQQGNFSKGMTTPLYSSYSLQDHQDTDESQRTDPLNQQVIELERGWTPAAIQMKVETEVENRIWATRMTKHVMDMNKHLQSCLLDLMQYRLLWPPQIDLPTTKKRKKLKVESSPLQGGDQPQFPGSQGLKELKGFEAKANGACQLVARDLNEQFVRYYIFPCLRAAAIYERKYLLGTSMARPVVQR